MMGLSKSTYYYRPKVSRAERDRRDADLRDKIEYLQAEFSCHGYRTIRKQLLRHYGMVVNGSRSSSRASITASGSTPASTTCRRWSLRIYCTTKRENRNRDRSP